MSPVALVSGGSSGIGHAVVSHLEEQGYNVVIGDLRPPASKTAFFKCDISSWEQQCDLFEYTIQCYGKVDVVFANAGISEHTPFLFEGAGDETARKPNLDQYNVNLIGTIYTMHLAVHHFRRQAKMGLTKGGAIVSTSSNAGLYSFPLSPNYCAAKHALVGLTRALGPRLSVEHIRIGTICPNCVPTGFGGPDEMPGFKFTDISVVVDAFQQILDNTTSEGLVLEASGTTPIKRDALEYVDQDTAHNMSMFMRWLK